jgi:transcriptional regulator with XRE-family HTH domain
MKKLDGPKIWAHIKRKRLTQRAVAVQAGISDGRLSEALRGRCALAPTDAKRLAAVLGVPTRSLLVPGESEAARGARR